MSSMRTGLLMRVTMSALAARNPRSEASSGLRAGGGRWLMESAMAILHFVK